MFLEEAPKRHAYMPDASVLHAETDLMDGRQVPMLETTPKLFLHTLGGCIEIQEFIQSAFCQEQGCPNAYIYPENMWMYLCYGLCS